MGDGGVRRLATYRLTTLGAVVAVVLAVTGIALVLTRPHHHRGSGSDTLRVVDSLPSDTATPDASETPTAQPSATPSPSPTDSPTTDPGSTGGDGNGGTGSGGSPPVMTDLGPIPPGSTVYAYSPGRDSWSASHDGVDLHVAMSPAHPHAGELVTFSLNATAPAKCCKGFILFGNGRATDNGTDCMGFPSGTGLSTSYTTTYNRSGRYEFEAAAYARDCEHSASLYAWIDIGAGTSTAQGPQLPTGEIRMDNNPPEHDGDPSYLSLYGHGFDDDGWVRHLIVDWGDGASATYPADDGACQLAADGWPAHSDAWLPANPYGPMHHYRSFGTFRVTLTIVSSACDGSDVQRGHVSMTWNYPAPPKPTPSSSPSPSPSAS